MSPKALIIRTAGTNCDAELAHAFELAGASIESVHLNQLVEQPQIIEQIELIGFPGGFSYGDDISAGRIFANRLQHRLRQPLQDAVKRGVPMPFRSVEPRRSWFRGGGEEAYRRGRCDPMAGGSPKAGIVARHDQLAKTFRRRQHRVQLKFLQYPVRVVFKPAGRDRPPGFPLCRPEGDSPELQ